MKRLRASAAISDRARRFHEETLLGDLQRRISAVSAERDAATIALDKLRATTPRRPDRSAAALRRRIRALTDERTAARRALERADAQIAALTHTVTEARRYYRALRADYRALLQATTTPTGARRAAGGHPSPRDHDIRSAPVIRLLSPAADPRSTA